MRVLQRLVEQVRASFRPAPSPVFPRETSLLDLDGFKPDGFVHGLEILNDDETPTEFVVMVLTEHAGLSENAAILTTIEIHRTGGALVPLASAEDARRAAEAIVARAADGGHPLVCRTVSVRESECSVGESGSGVGEG